MAVHSAVIDTDALVNIFSVSTPKNNLIGILRSLFSQIHIPLEVKNEFLKINDTHRSNFIGQLRIDRGFFCLCTRYDTLNLKLLSRYEGIDSGESEVIAQKLQVASRYIISDDQAFTRAVEKYDNTIVTLNSIHLIAMIDLHGLSQDSMSIKRALYKTRPFSQEQIREAYRYTSKLIGKRIGSTKLKKMIAFDQIVLYGNSKKGRRRK